MLMASSVNNQKLEKQSLLESYLRCAHYLVKKCQELEYIQGANKLGRKCTAELRYLQSLQRRRGGYDITHLKSSNLSHYIGILHTVQHIPDVIQILQAFDSPERSEPLHVDVVAGQGHVWVKVIARKAQALHLIWAGEGQYGDRDIIQQAKEYLLCSREHHVNFAPPKLIFAFYNGVTVPMAEKLRNMGIDVFGMELEVEDAVTERLQTCVLEDSPAPSGDNGQKGQETNKCTEMARLGECSRSAKTDTDDRLRISSHDDINSHDSITIAKTSFQNLFETETKRTEPGHRMPNVELFNERISSETNETVDLNESNYCLTVSPHSRTNDQLKTSFSSEEIGNMYCAKKQDCLSNYLHATVGENVNSNLPTWDMDDRSVLSFIETELLLKPLVDYSVLGAILADSRINFMETIQKINLDVTALITLVSSVSHGCCYFRFRESILSDQATEERTDPVLPKINKFIQGKRLYTCKTAADSFHTILETLGGPKEKERAKSLMENVTVVPDNPSFRTVRLPSTGKIKPRSKVIFGTGDSLQAVTLTANSGFVRAAHQQDVLFTVHMHASRALTEMKESTAERLSKSQ